MSGAGAGGRASSGLPSELADAAPPHLRPESELLVVLGSRGNLPVCKAHPEVPQRRRPGVALRTAEGRPRCVLLPFCVGVDFGIVPPERVPLLQPLIVASGAVGTDRDCYALPLEIREHVPL